MKDAQQPNLVTLGTLLTLGPAAVQRRSFCAYRSAYP